MIGVKCFTCKKTLLRSKNRVNESFKLSHNFYCSKICEGINKRKRVALKCRNCDKQFEKCQKDVLLNNYCSRSCAATINNQKFPKRGLGFKICKMCSKKFKGENIYCSQRCRKNKRPAYSTQKLLNIITSIANQSGRIPAKRELPEIAEICRHTFGSWNNAIKAAGLKPNRSHDNRMYKRLITLANDSHSCDSISEAIIDNWFSKNGIKHEKNIHYPKSNYRTDWVLANGNYVEYFGLAKDSPRYDKDIQKKKALCLKLGIQLIELYPQDLYPRQSLETKFLPFIK